MNYLIKSEFTLNWASLVALLVGMGLGVVLFILIYVLATLKAAKKNTYVVTDTIKQVTEEEVNEEITKAKKEFLIRKEEDKTITFINIRETIYELMKTIAKKYYPDSKEPLGELTVEELILLDHYIIEKIESLFNKRLLKPIKGLSANKILQIINTKNTIENNKIVKGIKKTGIKAIISTAYSALKVLNPVTWFNKIVTNPMINLITKQICLTSIEVIGQETNRVYSKQAFLEEVNSQELEALIKELDHQSGVDNNTIPLDTSEK